MITRKQYMAGDYTHSDYYGQFVDDTIKKTVIRHIGLDAIRSSTDEHMNDIPLKQWDSMPLYGYIGDQLRECGDYPTIAGSVSLYKTAARQIKDESS